LVDFGGQFGQLDSGGAVIALALQGGGKAVMGGKAAPWSIQYCALARARAGSTSTNAMQA
jgi:hypothetical protein